MSNDIVVYIKREFDSFLIDIVYPDGSYEVQIISSNELRYMKATVHDYAESVAIDSYESKYGPSNVNLSIF